GQVCYYDYLENKIKAEAELVGGIKLLAVGNNGFGDEIYGVLGQYELIILDANTLDIKEKFLASGQIYSIVTNDDGMIILSIYDDGDNLIQVLSRNDLSILNNNIIAFNSTVCHGIFFSSKEENELIVISEEELNFFMLDNSGNILDQGQVANPYSLTQGAGSSYYKVNGFSPLGNYIVSSSEGHVFDTSMSAISNLSAFGLKFYSYYFFNKEETVLYAGLLSYSGFYISYIDTYSVPDFIPLGSKEYTGNTPINLFHREDEILGAFNSRYFRCIFIKPVD
ncbi:MAG: hypothetical protein AB8F94_19825, partial [Saprospiraceae bacterium]